MYMSKLLSQGGFGCVYYPSIGCDGKIGSGKKLVTKLQKEGFNSNNEAAIGKLLSKVPDYLSYFLPVVSTCDADLRKIDKRLVAQCEVVGTDESKYMLMNIPFVPNKPFFSILSDTKGSKKKVMLTLTDTFTYMIQAIKLLLSKQIVHFDLKGDNVLYNTDTNDPQIIDFGISIPMAKVSDKNMLDYFYVYAPEYYVWPLEVHAINYLLHNTESSLTSADVDSICDAYVRSNKALEVFSEPFRELYKSACKRELTRFVSSDRDKAIYAFMSSYKTWDNYALSIIYLKVFEYLFPKGLHRNPMLIGFSQILITNASPDPSKRLTLDDTLDKFNDIFFLDGDPRDYQQVIEQMDYDPERTTRRINEDMVSLNKVIRRR